VKRPGKVKFDLNLNKTQNVVAPHTSQLSTTMPPLDTVKTQRAPSNNSCTGGSRDSKNNNNNNKGGPNKTI